MEVIANLMTDRLPLYTDLTILPIGGSNLKRYFTSIKRNLPKNWKNLFKEEYSDNDTFLIVNEFCCLQTPLFLDQRTKNKLYGKIFLGLTDESIIILKIEIIPEIPKEESIEVTGYINHTFNKDILEPNKHYSSFKHNFEFRGPYDENWTKTDFRDSRLIRLRSKADNTVYALSKSNHTKINDRKIYYPDANNISLSLSIMKKSYKKASKLYKEILKIDKSKTFTIEKKDQGLLYDYFEETLSCVIFAYVSVEAMCNAAIPEKYRYKKINEKGVKEIWSKENIERWMSTSDKIVNILPSVLKTTDIKQELFWSKFKELENLRNKIVHQRTIQEGTQLNTEIYEEMLQPTIFDKIKSGLSVIQFFYNFDNAHPYFPLGLGMAKFQIVEIESMEKHFKALDEK